MSPNGGETLGIGQPVASAGADPMVATCAIQFAPSISLLRGIVIN